MSAGIVEIPLSPQAQRFTITLGGALYRMRVTYNDSDEGGWVLDIGAEDGTILIAGIPLVTGADLLAQYAYLQLGGALVVTSDRDAGDLPTFDGLGTTSHLFFVPSA